MVIKSKWLPLPTSLCQRKYTTGRGGAGGETGVTVGIKAYIVYSKSAGDNRDLEQAVILTSGDP